MVVTGGSSIVRATAQEGGAIYVTSGRVALEDGSSIAQAAAFDGGAIAMVDRGNVTLKSSSIIDCNADEGGALYLAVGSNLLTDATTIVNSKAKHFGGAIVVQHSLVTLGNTSIVNSTADRQGGAIHSTSANITMLHTMVINSTSEKGGALYLILSTLNMTLGSCMSNSNAGIDGGAMFIDNAVRVIGADSTRGGHYMEDTADRASLVIPTVTVSNSSLVQSTALNDGGAIFTLSGSDIKVSHGSSIVNSTCQRAGGAMFLTNSTVVLTNSSLIGSTAQEKGGALYTFGGIIMLLSASIFNSVAGVQGGMAHLYSTKFTLSHSNVINSTAVSLTGGTLYVTHSNVFVDSCSIAKSSAGTDGGAIEAYRSIVVLTRGSSIVNTSAGNQAGAVSIQVASFTLTEGCSIFASSAARYGGAVTLFNGNFTMANGSSIVNATAALGGGAIYLDAGSGIVTGGCVIINSTSRRGGALYAQAGSLLVSNSSLVNATAEFGGAVRMTGGVVTFTSGSSISRVYATRDGSVISLYAQLAMVTFNNCRISLPAVQAADIAACFHIRRGELHLVSTIVEHGSATTLAGGLLHIEWVAESDGADPLFLVTLTEFRLHACDGTVFHQTGPAQIVLRNSTFTPLAACTADHLASPARFSTVTTMGCAAAYRDRQSLTWGVCSSTTDGACTESLVAGTTLSGLSCQCPEPQYPVSGWGSIAPYLPADGCVVPIMMTDLTVVSRSVSVSLSKRDSLERFINVTLHMQGNDVARPANWSVLDASTVLARSSWLHLPALSGTTDAEAISAGMTQVLIPLRLSASHQRESATAFTEMLQIDVRSSFGVASARTLPLHVALTVQAATEFIVWERVVWAHVQMRCKGSASKNLNSSSTAGELRRMPFTACDRDSLPVDHQIPSQSDNRRFSAQFTTLTTSQGAQIEYAGSGIYEVQVTTQTHGAFVVVVQLGDEEAGDIKGNSSCPTRQVALSDGRCGCQKGSFQLTENEPCTQCPFPTSSFDGARGIRACSVCMERYFQPSNASECEPCPDGCICPWATTTETLSLVTGFWRELGGFAPVCGLSPTCDSRATCLD
eukprot:604047-Prymnesium_polylepis.1